MPRSVVILAVVGALMLAAMAALHASGYSFVSGAIAGAELPSLLKKVLPYLFLYPSMLLLLLSAMSLVALGMPRGAPFLFGGIAAIVAANAVFGFVLGALVPGLVLALAAGLFAGACVYSGRHLAAG